MVKIKAILTIFLYQNNMPRFYVPFDLHLNHDYALPDKVVQHIHVLRLKKESHIHIFNGNGLDYYALLRDISKRHAICHIVGVHNNNTESPLKIKLVQSISNNNHMDFTLQKSVELGVHTIQPIISDRSTHLNADRAASRLIRWQEIVIAACEQCGRNTIPSVLPIQTFSHYLKHKSSEIHLMMSLNQPHSLKDFAPQQNITLMVGPEGGWTSIEEDQAQLANCHAISLGSRILRTETASLAAIAAMQTLWGDFL